MSLSARPIRYYNISTTIGSLSGNTDDTLVGWTAGGGVEYALTKHLSFKTEYLYVDLGKSTLYDGPLIAPGVDNLKIESDNHFHTIKGGLNYRF